MKDPTAFRNRFRLWKETGESQYEAGLPKFADGTEGYKYVLAGKNNEWSRITNDDMSQAFLDLIVRPKSRGGNTTVGNWNRRWSLKGEPGLEIVSPEFDIISGVRGIQQIFPLKNRIALKVGSVDFDNIAKQVAKMKADNDAWMAIHPEYNIESAINKTKLPNAYETFLFKPIHDVAKEPYYSLNQLLLNPKTSADVAKISPSVRSYAYTGSRTKFNPFGRGYVNLKSFLQSPAYRKRLENYYKQKGSSYVTISHAPDNRIGELLYNIETAKATIRPRGQLIDENGAIKDSFGLYDPNSHSIQVAVDALERLTPEHEMWHAARRAEPYLDNEKYKMRVKSLSEPAYYGNISELEVRVLDTLREMQESGLDINNLTDDQIWNFLMETPADMHGTNVQSLIDNYWYDDVKRALRNFKGFIPPIATIGIGHGLYNKYAE